MKNNEFRKDLARELVDPEFRRHYNMERLKLELRLKIAELRNARKFPRRDSRTCARFMTEA